MIDERKIKRMEDRHLCKARPIGTRRQWVTGFYAVLGEKTVIIVNEPEKFYDVDSGKNSHGNKIVEVISKTVCQCTGLKDKNGKLIFENDIMEAHIDEDFPEDVSRFKVEWNGKGWVENHPDGVDREYLDDFDTEHFKVVGNIFDNPELLEE